ncbi:hypothetical protein Y032_0046g1366 [Ancylostoma ceylanicum]|uniref:Uncharacterized protein n=1 Tax=Ancylostoma ceylanicum TaxID=53326 RepID=A0A016UCW9_9BILA|nr:hypothetical protein Y032_0046g1366 [Ancylostoma ceylanicum]
MSPVHSTPNADNEQLGENWNQPLWAVRVLDGDGRGAESMSVPINTATRLTRTVQHTWHIVVYDDENETGFVTARPSDHYGPTENRAGAWDSFSNKVTRSGDGLQNLDYTSTYFERGETSRPIWD